jgi:adenylate cyclase
VHSTPFQAQDFPGVEMHATTVANILSADFLSRPEWAFWIETAQILLLGVFLGIMCHRRSPFWAVWAALICVAVIIAEAYAAFWLRQIWFNVTYPLLFVIIDYLAITSYKYFTEEKQKRWIKNVFQFYVSSNVVDHLLQSSETLQLGGERCKLTALFSDIRGFTSISEKLSPEQLVEFLNEYLSKMSQLVLQYEGTLDKYMGDAIMAFYGAPIEQADHAQRACKTAVDMIVRLKELHVGWETRGLPPMDIGIGINSGDMSVGNMGSRDRFDYTIMGDNVNLASRLEGINKEYGTNIVISEFTYALIRHQSFLVRELDTVRVKGKDEPVTIYELLGYASLYEHKKPVVAKFCEGLSAYKQRDWNLALERFGEALELDPSDTPSAKYISRCEAYQHTPPPDDWDGVFVMTTK